MRINHNIAALNTYRQLSNNGIMGNKSLEKLSSGLRINRAGDDAAGLAMSEKMRGQIRGLDQASRNAQDGISMIQTAEGALNETHAILQRMRELAVQSANDTNTATDRAEIQKEVDQLAVEITRIANNTEFNTQKLLNGGVQSTGIGESTFQIGANASQNLSISIKAMDAKTLGVSRDITTATGVTAGDIDTVTFGSTLGDKVVDGANITFQYATGTATAAVKTADADLGGSVGFDTATKITIGGTDVTLTNIKVLGAAYDAATNIDTVVTELQKDIDATALNGQYTVGKDGSKLTITSTATGAAAAVDLTGSDAATGATLLGFSTLTAVNGADAGNDKITVSDGTTDQVVEITDATVTSFTVSSGNYQGITITTDALKTLADLDSTNDKVTVAVSTTAAAAAEFDTVNHVKTADAVTEAGIDVSTQGAANTAITTIQTSIETVSGERSKLGAYQNRLEHTINNLGTASENLSAAESRIRDVDMAKEMMEFTKMNILQQAAQAMLAQANQQPQGVLQLLR